MIFLLISLFFSSLQARIAVYGDTRGGEAVHASIVQAVKGFEPHLVLHTGDLSSNGKTDEEFAVVKSIIAPLAPVEFYPVRGNHERDEALFLKHFPQLKDSSRYVLERDSLVFIVLDSSKDLKPGSEQVTWLQTQLQAAKDKPAILLLHHPVWSSGAHGDELGLRAWLPLLLAESSVRAVISGHEHSYERSESEGITYLVTGGGGAPFRDARKPNPHSRIFIQAHHFLILERDGLLLRGKVYDPESALLDSFSIKLRP